MALKLPKTISKNQALSMLNQINQKCPTGCRNYAIVITMYRAGLRVSEVCKLTISDVNFETRLIYVQQSKGKKGKKKDRYVPMDDDVVSALKNWSEKRPESNYFFCTLSGGKVSDRYIREMCYRISEKSGVYIQDGFEKKKVSPHKLRHSFATDLLKSGNFNIREVQELLGHSIVSTTEIYTHVVMDEISEKFQKREPLAK